MAEYQDSQDELSTEELLSIVLKSEKHAANLAQIPLRSLIDSSRRELGISIAAFSRLQAGIELGRRVEEAKTNYKKPKRLDSSAAAIEFCRTHFARMISDSMQEQFHIVTLNTKLGVIGTHCITIGTLDASLVHPREVFRRAIKDLASSIILAHNHPSGDPTPSREDIAVTERLERAGETIGINVVDHIVMGRNGVVSIKEHEA